jgi:hypothetical protein
MTRAIRILLATSALAAALCAVPGGASAASSCKKLKVTDSLRGDLRDAHDALTDRAFSGPKRVHYGRCGTTYYALADFKDPDTGYQDQPERFRHRAGKPWKDLGDTGGPVCDTGFPRALLHAWGFDSC